MTEVYDTLIEAGTSEEKVRKAAGVLPDDDREFADIRSELKLMNWMQGATFAGVVTLIVHAFSH